MTPKIRLWTDDLPEQRFLEAILRHQPYADAIEIGSGLGGTSILSIGRSWLVTHPGQPVALVMNSNTVDPAELRDDIQGYMSYMSYVPRRTWLAVLAIPQVDNWALADPRIKQIFEDTPDLANERYNRAMAMNDLTATIPFNVQALRNADDDFRRLDDFLALHAGRLAPVAARS